MLFKKSHQFHHPYCYYFGVCWVLVSFTLVYKYTSFQIAWREWNIKDFCSFENNLVQQQVIVNLTVQTVWVHRGCDSHSLGHVRCSQLWSVLHTDILWSKLLGPEKEDTVLNNWEITSRETFEFWEQWPDETGSCLWTKSHYTLNSSISKGREQWCGLRKWPRLKGTKEAWQSNAVKHLRLNLGPRKQKAIKESTGTTGESSMWAMVSW